MADCIQSEIVNITTCSICLEKLTIPKYLPCLHTFCESCILAFISSGFEKGNKENIECPICRTVVSIPNENCSPEEWTKALPLNFLIVGLLESEKVQRTERQCMMCERIGKKVEAVSVCVDCSDLLCVNCTEYHKVNKYTSDHSLNKLDELPIDINSVKAFKNMCSEHKNKELELYCADHETPCCSMCVSIHHRKCEKVLSLEDAAKDIGTSEIVQDIKQQLGQVEEDINTVLTDRKTCLENFKSQYETEKKKLKSKFDDFITKVHSLKAQREAELLKVYNEVKENVETTLTMFQNKQKIIENEKKILDISLNKASEVQMMIEVYKLKHQIQKHKELIHNASDKIMGYTLRVTNEQKLLDILNQLENACQIACGKKQKSFVFVSGIGTKQSEIYQFNRFKGISPGWNVYSSSDAIKFSVSKDIQICGFLSYGCADGSSSCHVTASVNDGTSDIIKVTTNLDAKLADDKLLQIDFPKPIKLAANKNYHAVVVMRGPSCNNGTSGMSQVDCNGVTFTLQKSGLDNNGTSTTGGQIPGFLFKL